MKKKIPTRILTASLLCLLAVGAIVYLALQFTSMWQDEPIYPGPWRNGKADAFRLQSGA